MATYQINVPVVTQSKTMLCWHASAQMIWFYWQNLTHRAGPMFTLVKEWNDNGGVTVNDFIRLAKAVGLKAAPRKKTAYSSDDLAQMLRQHGPIWCAGFWYGPPHIVVLTGVMNDIVFINDPGGGLKKTGTVSWFNQKMAQVEGGLMYKDPLAY
ncbi:MAG: hypothetical protein LAP85_16170 [Acidobacteriia bacterium]|nr:hypothetical protein [Terriglobia bacterium]